MENEILIVPVNSEANFKVLRDQGFYRLPAEKGFSNPSKYSYLAVYRALPHKCVDHIARIKGVRFVKGRELDFGRYRKYFPHYKKGEDNYDRDFQKIEIGKLIRLTGPVRNRSSQPFRNSRATTFEKLLTADSVEDLTLRRRSRG